MAKVLIHAYEFKHAEYYAREVLHIGRASWTFIIDDWNIRGCHGMELILLNAPRYIPSLLQLEKRSYLTEACFAWGINIKRVELP